MSHVIMNLKAERGRECDNKIPKTNIYCFLVALFQASERPKRTCVRGKRSQIEEHVVHCEKSSSRNNGI